MNKDQEKSRIDGVKDQVKEVAGNVTGDKKPEQKGTIQNTGGKVQAGLGGMKSDAKESGNK